MPYANNKGANQPAHPRSLISAFVVRLIDSIISLVSISESASLYPASVAAQAGLSLTWSKTPKTGFLMKWLICFGPHIHILTCLCTVFEHTCIHNKSCCFSCNLVLFASVSSFKEARSSFLGWKNECQDFP